MKSFFNSEDKILENENKTEILDFSSETQKEYEGPKTIKSFDKLELKGQGGQGEVWKARNKETDQIIALKIIYKNRENLDFAQKEIEILKKISTPCYTFISCYYDSSYDGNNFLIEMEYIEGRDLEAFRKENIDSLKYLENKLVDFMKIMTTALVYIHSKDVVHRDIKPQNILITNDLIPKLVDFGLSCETEICDKLFCCSGNSGTPVLMAPETILLNKSFFVSDVWSLGTTFYKVSTGNYCFKFPDINNIRDVIYTVAHEKPKKLETRNKTLNIVVNLCIESDFLKRITSEKLLKIFN